MHQRKLLFGLFIFVFSAANASAAISNDEKTMALQQLEKIQNAINEQSISTIHSAMSPNASSELRDEIELALTDNKVTISHAISSIKETENSNLKIKAKYSVEGENWSARGFSNWYIFEKVDQQWLLLDTNFHTKITAKSMLVFFVPGFIVAALWLIFWLWMLIDLANAPMNKKALWVLAMLFTGGLGSLIYFFTARRKYRKNIRAQDTVEKK